MWAPDLAALLEQAARGICTLTGTRLSRAPVERELGLEADPESSPGFLHAELLYLGEADGLGFDD